MTPDGEPKRPMSDWSGASYDLSNLDAAFSKGAQFGGSKCGCLLPVSFLCSRLFVLSVTLGCQQLSYALVGSCVGDADTKLLFLQMLNTSSRGETSTCTTTLGPPSWRSFRLKCSLDDTRLSIMCNMKDYLKIKKSTLHLGFCLLLLQQQKTKTFRAV